MAIEHKVAVDRLQDQSGRVRYTKTGGFNIAYQVVGDGPVDMVLLLGWVTHLELAWEIPELARFLSRLASFCRLIIIDKRGTGLSDRVAPDNLPTLEERMGDILAVLDAVGSEQAVLFGSLGGGAMCGLFAATYPERTIALILYGTFGKLEPNTGLLARIADTADEALDRLEREWGTEGVGVAFWAPSLLGDEEGVSTYLRMLRSGASPSAGRALMQVGYQIDWEGALPAIHVPTMVLHRVGDLVAPISQGRWLAQQIPDATFAELPGMDHLIWVGDQDAVLDRVESFVGQVRPTAIHDRVLATILVTDVVGSTERLTDMGDGAWRGLLKAHHAAVRANLERFSGREVGTTGDGFLATFRGPAQAIRCAQEIINATRPLGLQIRAGVHSGEYEVVESDVTGIAVHVAARVSALAGPGEILTSRTVRDLAAGSGIRFESRGTHALKGVDGDWELFQASIQS